MRNCISYLMDAGGHRVFNQLQIKEMVVAYFQNLLGSEEGVLQDIAVEELRGLLSYRCPQEVADQLISIPTEADIKSTFLPCLRIKLQARMDTQRNSFGRRGRLLE